MSLAKIYSRGETGIQAPLVLVEVHVAGGLPGMTIVGLPTTAVREAKDRVRSALQSSGFQIPARRITINLAPAELPKDGGRFDLPMALGILKASGQLAGETDGYEFAGELSLAGELRPISGAISAVLAHRPPDRRLILPSENAVEAGPISPSPLLAADSLLQVCAYLQQQGELPSAASHNLEPTTTRADLRDVRGQAQAKRALELAACGRHNLLLIGPPGSGKSMLASRLPGLLPPLEPEEARELACICSAARHALNVSRWREPPFRAPHHSASAAALVGGGSRPRPGEISLAHGGALFLDELPEFSRHCLEMLREPLECGQIRISRVRDQIAFPARFQLLAAMNPCPCGYLGDTSGRCHCSEDQVRRYQARISGPLLDRIDLCVRVPRIPVRNLIRDTADDESSADVQERVRRARERQMERAGRLNAELRTAELERYCELKKPAQVLLENAAERLQLSGRALHRSLKLARTIADLSDAKEIETPHLAEALQYRFSAGL